MQAEQSRPMTMPAELNPTSNENQAPVTLVPKQSPSPPQPASQKRHTWLIIGLVAMALVIAAAAAWTWSAASPPAQYTEAAVTRGDVTRTVAATGTVNPVLTIIVGSYVSGVIQEIHCDYNTQVKQGQSAPRSTRARIRPSSTRTKPTFRGAGAAREDPRPISLTRSSITSATPGWRRPTPSPRTPLDLAKNALDQAKAQIARR